MTALNELPLSEHLAELRKRLIACLVVVFVSFSIILGLYIDPVMAFLPIRFGNKVSILSILAWAM